MLPHPSCRRFRPALALSALVLIGLFPTRAQADATPVISLSDAIAYARSHQPAIRVALARVQAQQSAAQIPRAQWLPKVGVGAQAFAATSNNTTASTVTRSAFDIPRIGGSRVVSTGSLQPYPSTFVGAGANQEVFDFGRIAAQAAAEDARVEVEQRSAEVAELEVNFEVEEAYLAVFAAKAVMRASDDAYQRARVHRDFAKVGVSAGMRPPIELTRSEADLARFDVGRLRALGGLEIAQTVLAAAVGSPEAKLDVVDTPPTLQAMPALQTAIARAQLRDPRLRQALSELKAQEAQTRSLASALLPDLSLSLSVTGRAGGAAASGNGESPYGSGWLPTTPNWDVGLVFSWPLFDGTVQAKRDASRAFEGGRREEIDQVKQQQIAAIRESYSRFHIARGVLQGLGDGLTAAKANYEQADARFKSGMGTSVELADAEAIRTDAEIQLALGEFELARARAAFGRAIAEGM